MRDFLSNAIDENNLLSAAKCYFISEKEDAKKSLGKPIRQIIKIDTLKKLLNGAYKCLAATFSGTKIKISMFEFTLEDLRGLDE